MCVYVYPSDESPDPSEVFMAVRLSETKVAFKSGYGRYLGVDSSGELVGQAEAVGPRETWEPVFEDVCTLCTTLHRADHVYNRANYSYLLLDCVFNTKVIRHQQNLT